MEGYDKRRKNEGDQAEWALTGKHRKGPCLPKKKHKLFIRGLETKGVRRKNTSNIEGGMSG